MHTASPFEFPPASNPFASPVAPGTSVFAPLAPSGCVDVAFEAVPDAAPSARDLLARAARLGPARPTLESILMPSDPVLGQKQQPAIAARRMRFTRIVKATLGACVALCVAALTATAMSGEASAASHVSTRTASAAAPSRRVSSVEPLSGDVRAKAKHPTGVATARGAKAPSRAKRR